MSPRLPEPGRRIRRVVRLADGRSLHPDLGDRWTDVEGDRADLD